MWKDFFYFSKGQRIGIVALLTLIVLIVGLDILLPKFFPKSEIVDSQVKSEMETFARSLKSLDSLRAMERQREYESRYRSNYPNRTFAAKSADYTLFSFDPNKADSATFVRLGLKPYVAANIVKYRQRGGKFSSAEGLAKIYGISEEKFAELRPYISIESAPANSDSVRVAAPKTTPTAYNENIVVELNTADSIALMEVRGVGRFLARSIVRFRTQSGGFVSVEQLLDVYGIHEENYLKIKDFFTVDKSLVRAIRVNTASVDKLKSHPYLNFYQAKAIYELRRKVGRLKNIQELKKLEELDEQTLLKLSPYLSFD